MGMMAMASVLTALMLPMQQDTHEVIEQHHKKTHWCTSDGCIYENVSNEVYTSVSSKHEDGCEVITVITTDKNGKTWKHEIRGGKVTTTDNENDIEKSKQSIKELRCKIEREQKERWEKFDRDMKRLDYEMKHMFDHTWFGTNNCDCD